MPISIKLFLEELSRHGTSFLTRPSHCTERELNFPSIWKNCPNLCNNFFNEILSQSTPRNANFFKETLQTRIIQIFQLSACASCGDISLHSEQICIHLALYFFTNRKTGLTRNCPKIMRIFANTLQNSYLDELPGRGLRKHPISPSFSAFRFFTTIVIISFFQTCVKFLAVPRQLNRWPCHWLTDWVLYTLLKNTTTDPSKRLVTLETCDQRYEETWPDQNKDNDKGKDNDKDI